MVRESLLLQERLPLEPLSKERCPKREILVDR